MDWEKRRKREVRMFVYIPGSYDDNGDLFPWEIDTDAGTDAALVEMSRLGIDSVDVWVGDPEGPDAYRGRSHLVRDDVRLAQEQSGLSAMARKALVEYRISGGVG